MATWDLYEDGYHYDSIEAESAEEALDEARGNVDRSNYGDESTGTIWIDVRVECPDTAESAEVTVTLDPEEPACSHGDGHDWRSPYSLLGGLKENPGVWGHGGGVVIHEVCMHCGCGKKTDTWAQRRDTGEQGLTSVSYERRKYEDEVEELRVSRAIDAATSDVWEAGCSEAREAAACLLLQVRAILAGDEPLASRGKHASRLDDVVRYLERVYRAVRRQDEARAVRLALRLAADDDAERRVAEAVIGALWPVAMQEAA